MYAIPALSLATKQTDELNVCWNTIIRKVFGYHKWESVSAVLLGLGRLNVKHLIMLRNVKFCRHLFYHSDAFLRNVFLMFFVHNFNRDTIVKSFSLDMMQSVMYGCPLNIMLICSLR